MQLTAKQSIPKREPQRTTFRSLLSYVCRRSPLVELNWSADTFNSQPFSPPRNGPEVQPISDCNRCQGRLEYESDKKQNGNWYKLCSHCRSSARDYQGCRREKRATDEPDLSNRPRKVRVIQPRPTPVLADNAMGNGQYLVSR